MTRHAAPGEAGPAPHGATPKPKLAPITRATPISELPEFLTPNQVAAFLQLGRTALYEALRKGEIPSVRLNRLIRIQKQTLLARLRTS